MNNPQTQQLQTKTDINTTEMTPKTCTQDNKLQRSRSNHRDPWTLNTTPGPHPQSNRSEGERNTTPGPHPQSGENEEQKAQISFWTNQPMEKSHENDNKKFEFQGQTQISKYWPINDEILNLIPVFKVFKEKKMDIAGSTSASIPVGGSMKKQLA
jgi:hypothetical protein